MAVGVGMLWSAAVNLMTHVDPWKRPDLDHGAVAATRGTATSEVAEVVGSLTWLLKYRAIEYGFRL